MEGIIKRPLGKRVSFITDTDTCSEKVAACCLCVSVLPDRVGVRR